MEKAYASAWSNSDAAIGLSCPAAHTPCALPSRVPLPVIKLEEDAVLFGSAEPGHRQCGCSHTGPDAVISCHREEGLARLDTRAKQSKQTPNEAWGRGRDWKLTYRPSAPVSGSCSGWGGCGTLRALRGLGDLPNPRCSPHVNKLGPRAAGLQAWLPWQCSLFLSLGFHQDTPLLTVCLLHRAEGNSSLHYLRQTQVPGAAERRCLLLPGKSSHLIQTPPKFQKRLPKPHFPIDNALPPPDIQMTPLTILKSTSEIL